MNNGRIQSGLHNACVQSKHARRGLAGGLVMY